MYLYQYDFISSQCISFDSLCACSKYRYIVDIRLSPQFIELRKSYISYVYNFKVSTFEFINRQLLQMELRQFAEDARGHNHFGGRSNGLYHTDML